MLVLKAFSLSCKDSDSYKIKFIWEPSGTPYYINYVDNLDYIKDGKITFILNDFKQRMYILYILIYKYTPVCRLICTPIY